MPLICTLIQLEAAKKKQEDELRKLQAKLATPIAIHVTEGATDDQEETQVGVYITSMITSGVATLRHTRAVRHIYKPAGHVAQKSPD